MGISINIGSWILRFVVWFWHRMKGERWWDEMLPRPLLCCGHVGVKYAASRSLLTYTESLDTVKRLRWRNENSPVLERKTINRVRKVNCRNTSTEQKVRSRIMSISNIRLNKDFQIQFQCWHVLTWVWAAPALKHVAGLGEHGHGGAGGLPVRLADVGVTLHL